MYFFQSLREEYKYSFLFISREPLEHSPGFSIVQQRLKPLNDNESIEYILTNIADTRAKVYKHKRKPLLSRRKLKEKILNSLAFKQAHGYPKLLHLLNKRLAKGVDALKIDLLSEPKLEPYFKDMIMNYEINDGKLQVIPRLEYAHSSNYPAQDCKNDVEDIDSELFFQPKAKKSIINPIAVDESVEKLKEQVNESVVYPFINQPQYEDSDGLEDNKEAYKNYNLSLIHICRCRRYAVCRSRWSP
eukprot:TRINITY_DN9940_c0_g2_i2.p1 TRINITY_DN9940_c0_g2~~TRINITY_DN9940_c0_g2_i2.p1  ORF type:complete len:245 (-),score=63.53 TRINITY_DN9940_c0_g2_i2:51-785(-)